MVAINSDDSRAHLVDRIYGRIRRGESPSEALR